VDVFGQRGLLGLTAGVSERSNSMVPCDHYARFNSESAYRQRLLEPPQSAMLLARPPEQEAEAPLVGAHDKPVCPSLGPRLSLPLMVMIRPLAANACPTYLIRHAHHLCSHF
jgi:hypothetical protein